MNYYSVDYKEIIYSVTFKVNNVQNKLVVGVPLLRTNVKIVMALFASVIIISGTIALIMNFPNFNQNQNQNTDDQIYADVDAEFTINSSTLNKGENIPSQLRIQTNISIHLLNFTLEVRSQASSRTAQQKILINQTISAGSHEFMIEVKPYFKSGGMVVLSPSGGEYTIYPFQLSYETNSQFSTFFTQTSQNTGNFIVTDFPVYEQMRTVSWTATNSTDATHSIDGNLIEVNSTSDQGFIELETTINTTGYTRLYYSQVGILASITINLNGSNYFITDDYIEIGNIIGMQNLIVTFDFISDGLVTLNLTLPTQKKVIYTTIASDNWDGTGSDSFIYQPADYYVDEMSIRFEVALNVTFYVVDIVEFDMYSTSNLTSLIEEAKIAVGSAYNLPTGNWTAAPRTHENNAGLDVLLICTNQTMEYFGIVIASGGGAFNMAVQARGSYNAQGFRLSPSRADNLIQHEVSHIFGAPDRYTSSSDPSVMTKPANVDELLSDIWNGNLWLDKDNWLEEDIQTMYDNVDSYS